LGKVEICAGCGTVARESSGSFKCGQCGSDISIVVSAEIFKKMVEAGLVTGSKKQEQ
jgi:hypothetical protein